ncbi:MAG: ATP-binding protein [Peptococcaceae bacterium]|nr:ATP-binding protein [Peptococcaceae bacterium]
MRELSLHILDIVQNSIAAQAKNIEIYILESEEEDRLTLMFRDDGKGMTREEARKVTDPFFTSRTTRRVGLGAPMLKATAQACEGDVSVESAVGKGTVVRADFRLSHIDLPPLGDMVSTLIALVTGSRDVNFKYEHRNDYERFAFTTAEMREILGDLPFSDPEVLNWLQDFLEEGEASLKIST